MRYLFGMERLTEQLIHKFYIRWIFPLIPGGLERQRVKLFWFGWTYRLIFRWTIFPLRERLRLIYMFLRIDWHIEHSHWPCEILDVCHALVQRFACPREIMVEAGCWKGGSTAKFSLVCQLLGYKLHVYDSFEGVESVQEKGYDFSGEYSAGEDEVKDNLRKYGVEEVCIIHKGWFSETIKPNCENARIFTVYIDCDLAKGTEEVLKGVLPWLTDDGFVFTQDYHISSVKQMLQNSATWARLGASQPIIQPLCHNLAVMKFHQ